MTLEDAFQPKAVYDLYHILPKLEEALVSKMQVRTLVTG